MDQDDYFRSRPEWEELRSIFLSRAEYEKRHGQLTTEIATETGNVKTEMAKISSSLHWNRGLMILIFASVVADIVVAVLRNGLK